MFRGRPRWDILTAMCYPPHERYGFLLKIGLLKYCNSVNIGDNIQTLAVAQHVKHRDHYVERDFMNEYNGDECVVVMNGWFSNAPDNWPPSDRIIPLFFGFHMTLEAAESYRKHKQYFKKHEPIGCRDPGTADILGTWGIKAYVSGCATMTFAKRKQAPDADRVVLVDVDKSHFNREERGAYCMVSHILQLGDMSNETKNAIATDLLDFYRSTATCIVTSRIHCAMPCLAMGIPTIYCGVKEYRTRAVEKIGMQRFTFPRFRHLKAGQLPFHTHQFEQLKGQMITDLKTRLLAFGVAVSNEITF